MAPSRPPRLAANRSSKFSKDPKDPKEQLKRRGADLIRKISDKDRFGIFLDPVDLKSTEGYAETITRPMDLSTLQSNLADGVYRTPIELRTDLDLIWSNCCIFNADDSIYFKEAVRLRAQSARQYDDFIRNLSRDGVAAALGLTTRDKPNTPSAARVAAKRPPRHRGRPPTVTPSSTPATPAAPPHPLERDVPLLVPATALPAVSPHAAICQAQLRRAHANYEAALEAVNTAKKNVTLAAKKAGVPTPEVAQDAPHAAPSSDGEQIFVGPASVLHKRKDGRDVQLHPAKYTILNSGHLRSRCARIPEEWQRIGRWHPPGTTHTPFLSEDRARDVKHGHQFQRYVKKTAPVARRLLASILDPAVVMENDANVIAASEQPGGNQAISKAGSYAMSGKNLRVNGLHEANEEREPEVESCARTPSGEGSTSRKRPRSKMSEAATPPNGKSGAKGEKFVIENLLLEVLGPERMHKMARKRDQLPEAGTSIPNKTSISKMRSLLKNKGIDPSFVNGLIADTEVCEKKNAGVEGSGTGDIDGQKRCADEKLNGLLHSNYQAIMNTLRLRAVRDSVNEAEREEVEDRERECAEQVAKGVALAVGRLPPRLLVHPLDAAETALTMCRAGETTELGKHESSVAGVDKMEMQGQVKKLGDVQQINAGAMDVQGYGRGRQGVQQNKQQAKQQHGKPPKVPQRKRQRRKQQQPTANDK